VPNRGDNKVVWAGLTKISEPSFCVTLTSSSRLPHALAHRTRACHAEHVPTYNGLPPFLWKDADFDIEHIMLQPAMLDTPHINVILIEPAVMQYGCTSGSTLQTTYLK